VSALDGGRERVCADCGARFAVPPERPHDPGDRGLPPPTRCEACRVARRAARNARLAAAHDRLTPIAARGPSRAPGQASGRLYPAVCDVCGRDTRVPFRPGEGRPVYCRSCLDAVQGR